MGIQEELKEILTNVKGIGKATASAITEAFLDTYQDASLDEILQLSFEN